MTLDEILASLFPAGHAVRADGPLVAGTGRAASGEVAVVGTTGAAEVGVELALALAAEVLRVVREAPGRPILALVDTSGQRMSLRDELLALNGYLGHLAASVELARRSRHRVLALVTGEAVSAGALALGFLADEVHALPGARLAVMSLPAMARVTKLPLARLEALSKGSPVLAPGLDSYVRLGAIASVWEPPLAPALNAALGRTLGGDARAARGAARGGRLYALGIARRMGANGRGR